MMLVTYASADGYTECLQKLLATWRGEVFLEILPPEWPWTRVCSYRPTLLQHAAGKHAGVCVYIDADGYVKTPFTEGHVVAALEGKAFGCRRYLDGGIRWMCAGTVLFDTRHGDCAEWLAAWRGACDRRPDRELADTAHLTDLATEFDHAELAPAWCWMEPTTPAKAVPPPDPVYIWHMQASRRFAGAKGGHGTK